MNEPNTNGVSPCPSQMFFKSKGRSFRCERVAGHGGLHSAGEGFDEYAWSSFVGGTVDPQ